MQLSLGCARAVTDHELKSDCIDLSCNIAHNRRKFGIEDDHCCLSIVEQIGQLFAPIAVVHIERDGSELCGRNECLEILGAIHQIEPHRVPAPNPPVCQRACDAV